MSSILEKLLLKHPAVKSEKKRWSVSTDLKGLLSEVWQDPDLLPRTLTKISSFPFSQERVSYFRSEFPGFILKIKK